jgi:hypothetical protein
LSDSKPTKNAFSHGLYSDDIVLDCENKQEFVDLWQAFQDEYCPRQKSEEAAVMELANLHWKKRRVEAGIRQVLNKRGADRIADVSSDVWHLIVNDIGGVAKSHLKAARVACEIISKHLERVSNPNQTTADGKAIDFEKLTVLAKELNIVSKELVVPILHATEKGKLDQLERAFDSDIIERELKIQAEIDRRIDKVLKRLVMIKEYKRFYVVKSIDSKPLSPIGALPAEPTGVSVKTEPKG